MLRRHTKKKNRRSRLHREMLKRKVVIEQLERRDLLATAIWNNVLQPFNVDGDDGGFVSPIDALLVINELNRRQHSDPSSGRLPKQVEGDAAGPFFDVSCDGFASPLDALLVINHLNAGLTGGGSDDGSGSYANQACAPELAEGTKFSTHLSRKMVVPNDSAAVEISFQAPQFDVSSQRSIRDAFEIEVTDQHGNPVVLPFAYGRDAVYNWSESLEPVFAPGVTITTNPAHQISTATINLTGLASGTEIHVTTRLVNNDLDQGTRVVIRGFEFVDAHTSATDGVIPPTNSADQSTAVDLSQLTPVGTSVRAEFHRTTLTELRHGDKTVPVLHAGVILHNQGTFDVRAPVLLVFDRFDEPEASLIEFDGHLSDGRPFIDFSSELFEGKLAQGAQTELRSLSFLNPSSRRFSFTTSVLASINRAPSISSAPPDNVDLDQEFSYQIIASDEDADAISYRLFAGPEEMTVHPATGLIRWVPTEADIGNHRVGVEVSDLHGGASQQEFTLSVLESIPNRPPLFTSLPEVDATVASFFEVIEIPVGEHPVGVTLGDFTGFDENSIVTANSAVQTLSILEGQAPEAFVFQGALSVGEPQLANRNRVFNEPLLVEVGFSNALANSNDVFGLAAADFNGDQHLDLAASLFETNSTAPDRGKLSILLSRGDGTFEAPRLIHLPNTPDVQVGQSLLANDFDNDGQADLILTAQATPEIIFFKGDGSGNFAPGIATPSGLPTDRVQTADINADGVLDLAVGYFPESSAAILMGMGDGRFAAPTIFSVPHHANEVMLIDVDAINGVDLVVSTSLRTSAHTGPEDLIVRLNDGQGNFGDAIVTSMNSQSNSRVRAVQLADFDSDGLTDAVVNQVSNINFLKGNGDGTFADPARLFDLNPELVHAYTTKEPVDLNGDRHNDVVFGHRTSNMTVVGLGRGDGTFDFSTYIATSGATVNTDDTTVESYHAVLPGDFNSDGVVDLAVSAQGGNEGPGHVGLILGESQGLFASASIYGPINNGLSPVALADVNNDGIVDLLQSRAGVFNSGITVYPGQGNGRFGEGYNALTGFVWRSFLTADFNNDGNPDLLGTNQGRYLMSYGLGNGFFTPIQTLTPRVTGSADGIHTLFVGDFNHDGLLDFGGRTNQFTGARIAIEIWLNDPTSDVFHLVDDTTGLFALGAAGNQRAVVMGDFDGDGLEDLVTHLVEHDDATERLWFFKGHSAAEVAEVVDLFLPPVVVDPGIGPIVDFAAKDLNEDGLLDLVGVGPLNSTDGRTTIMLGKGDGTFEAALKYAGAGNELILDDVSGDGIIDVVVGGAPGGIAARYGMATLIGRGDGTFSAPIYQAMARSNTVALAAADLDGDGTIDIANGSPSSETSQVYLNLKPGLTSVATADLNRDRHLDLLATNAANGRVKVMLGRGDSTFSRQADLLVGRGPAQLIVGDLNGDQIDDIATSNEYDDTISILLAGSDGTFTRTDLEAGDAPVGIAMGDLTGDGLPDIAVANAHSNSLSMFINLGNDLFTTAVEFALGAVPRNVAIGDVTGDGLNDVLISNPANDRLTILPGQNADILGAAIFVDTSASPLDVAIGDLNEDGRLDLAVSLPTEDAVSVHYSRGGGVFSRPQHVDVGSHPTDVELVDVNNDGRQDVLVANSAGDSVSVVYNRFDQRRLYVYDAEAVDADGDALTFNLANSPAGMLLDRETGEISWGPSIQQAGPNSVTLEVADGNGGIATQHFTVHVSGRTDNAAPLITATPTARLPASEIFRQSIRAVDPDGDQPRYMLLSGPEGMTIGEIDGAIHWDPSTPGLEFDGNDVAVIPSSADQQPASFTLETWARFDAIADYTLIRKENTNVPSFRLEFNDTGELIGRVGGNSSNFLVSATFEPVVGQWYHLAFTYSETRDLSLFVDGQRVATANRANADLVYGETPVTLGDSSGSGFNHFVGALDEFRIWSEVRDEASIQASMHRQLLGNETGLVGYYRFDERENIRLLDSSLSENHGLLSDGMDLEFAPGRKPGVALAGGHDVAIRIDDRQGASVEHRFTLDVLPQFSGSIHGTLFHHDFEDGALQFDGSNDVVEIPDSASLHSDRGLTVSGWFRAESLARRLQTIFYKGNSPDTNDGVNREYALFLERQGYLVFASTAADQVTEGQSVVQTPAFVETGQWYHFAAVIDNDAAMLRLYINGDLLAYGPYTFANIRDTQGPLMIGDSPTNTHFSGSVDELRIYNAARSETEIRSDMTSALIGDEPHIVAAWNFDESNGAQVFDSTGNGNDGLLGGDGIGNDLPLRTLSDAPSSRAVARSRTIYIDGNENGFRDATDVFTQSDHLGQYVIRSLNPGVHRLVLEPTVGVQTMSPDGGAVNVSVDQQQATTVDFAITNQQSDSTQSRPRITSEMTMSGRSDELFEYSAIVHNPDGRKLTFDLPIAPDGMVIDSSTGFATWRPTIEQAGEHRVLLRVADERGLLSLQDATIHVAPSNSAPHITSTSKLQAIAGRSYLYQVHAQDAEDPHLTYRLDHAPSGMTIHATTGLIEWQPSLAQPGAHQVDVVASDSESAEAKQTYTLSVVLAGENSNPQIVSAPRRAIRFGDRYLYQVVASDQNADSLILVLNTHPHGMGLNEQGLISWLPTSDQLGIHSVEVGVSDGQGGVATQQFEVEVRSAAPNSPPVIHNRPLGAAVVDQVFAYDLDATDPDGDPLEFLLEHGPPGMSLNPRAGTLRFRPRAEQVGVHQIELSVLDAQGAETQQQFALRVYGGTANSPPQIHSVPGTETAVGKSFLYSVHATDLDLDSLTYALSDAPLGMSIDALTGDLSWTPDPAQIGTHSVKLVVTDDRGGFNAQAFSVTVQSGGRNLPPVFEVTPPRFTSVDELYQFQLVATDPDGQDLSYRRVRGPDSITVDASTGLVRWSPTELDIGLNNLAFAATDQAGATSLLAFELLVLAANNAPSILSSAPAQITVGAVYHYSLLANDPDHEPLSYRLVEGPTGAAIDGLGQLRWPTPIDAVGSSHPFQIEVRDVRGGAALQSFVVELIPDTSKPLVAVIPNRLLVDVGQNLLVKVAATDNVGVVSLSVRFDDKPVPLDAMGRAVIPHSPPGGSSFFNFHTLTASAVDASGNVGTGLIRVNFRNQFASGGTSNAPTVKLTSPADNAIVTSPIDIIGSVQSDNFSAYRLLYKRADRDDSEFVEFASGTEQVMAGVLGLFDPTLLENGAYTIRLEATDAAAGTVFSDRTIGVSGNLKLGNFRLSFIDLTVPVNGIPITVIRTYDSLRAQDEGDFGFGWRMEFRDTNLITSLPSSGLEDIGVFPPMRPGVKIYATLPGQQRQGWTFTPEIITLPGLGGNLTIAKPRFIPDPGNTSQLTTLSRGNLLVNELGELFSAGGIPWNPGSPDFGGGYVISEVDGTRYSIDGLSGQLTRVEDALGNELFFTDSGVRSDSGREVLFERDVRNRVVAAHFPTGETLKYEYDSVGDLVAVVDPGGNTTRFRYKAVPGHYLDQIIDPLDRPFARIEYDDQGRVAALVDALGNRSSVNHDLTQNTQFLTNALGHTTVLGLDQFGNVLSVQDANGAITQRTYDEAHNLTSLTNALGETTTFTYDSRGLQLAAIDANGNRVATRYDRAGLPTHISDPLGLVTVIESAPNGTLAWTEPSGMAYEFFHDARGNLLSTSGPIDIGNAEYGTHGELLKQSESEMGYAKRLRRDASGRIQESTVIRNGEEFVTSYEYDSRGNIIQTESWNGAVNTREFDANGNLISEMDAYGNRTRYRYDDLDRLIELIYPDATPAHDADNARRFFEYDALGQLIAETNELGMATRFRYDAVGNQISITYPDRTPDDDTDNPFRSFEYDVLGRVIAETNERGNRTEFEYDRVGNNTLIRDALGNETRLEYNAKGDVVSITDAMGRKLQHVLDAFGKRSGIVYPDGSSERLEINHLNQNAVATDSAGHTSRYDVNARGRISRVVDALGGVTSFEFNPEGLVTTSTDPLRNTTSFTYDIFGNRTSIALPMGETQRNTYDLGGRIVSSLGFGGQRTTMEYDARGRLVNLDYAGDESVDITYLSNGLPHTVTDSAGTTTLSYDERDRLISRTDVHGRTMEYEYDSVGNVTALIAEGRRVEFVHDALGRLISVAENGETVVQYSYDAVGNLLLTSLSNGTSQRREYDELNRVVTIANAFKDGSEEELRMTYTASSQVNRILHSNGDEFTYAYDALGRLSSETQRTHQTVSTTHYQYDAAGNRVRKQSSDGKHTDFTYDANNRLTQSTAEDGTRQYTYDGRGNLQTVTLDGVLTTSYQWDSRGRLIAVDVDGDGSHDVLKQYDYAGNLIAETRESRSEYLVDIANASTQVIAEFSEVPERDVEYLYGLGPVREQSNGEQRFYHTNHQGSVVGLSDSSGLLLQSFSYDAFGNSQDHSQGTGTAIGYTGERRDPTSGLYFLRSRHLHPELGRFLEQDIFDGFPTVPQSLNRYTYVHNDPVNLTDPSGFSPPKNLAELSVTQFLQHIATKATGVYQAYKKVDTALEAAATITFLVGAGAQFLYAIAIKDLTDTRFVSGKITLVNLESEKSFVQKLGLSYSPNVEGFKKGKFNIEFDVGAKLAFGIGLDPFKLDTFKVGADIPVYEVPASGDDKGSVFKISTKIRFLEVNSKVLKGERIPASVAIGFTMGEVAGVAGVFKYDLKLFPEILEFLKILPDSHG